MGVVWDARHRATGLEVAIKTVVPDIPAAAFHREVQAVAALRHRSIVEVDDEGVVAAEDATADIPVGSRTLVVNMPETKARGR